MQTGTRKWNELELKLMKLGIRQLAAKLKTSHTSVKRAMDELGIVGENQGKGLATLLSEDDQRKIAARFGVSSVSLDCPTSNDANVSIVPAGDDAPLMETRKMQPVSLQVVDSTAQLTTAIADLTAELAQWRQNSQSIESAMLQSADMEGAELGTRYAIRKVGRAAQTANSLEVQLAKELGLVSDQQQSA